VSVYDYRYDSFGAPPDADGRYDEETRAIIRRNVSYSLTLDAVRSTLGPTASQLRARVRRELADSNGRGGKP
jgi:hypothetical protein